MSLLQNIFDLLVESRLKGYRGETLDQILRREDVAESLVNLFVRDVESGNLQVDVVIVSGKFGQLLKKFLSDFTLIVLPGKLRGKDAEVPDLSGWKQLLAGSKVAFLDDTSITRSTESRVKMAVREQGGELVAGYYALAQPYSPIKSVKVLFDADKLDSVVDKRRQMR